MKARLSGIEVRATMTGRWPPRESGTTETSASAISPIIPVPVRTPVKTPAAKIIVVTSATLFACFSSSA